MMARSMRLKRQIDRRALLQRARRSPIRPRSSRAEERARAVSPAKDGRTERMFEREAMNQRIQEWRSGDKWGTEPS
jgi:hypothetical protein